jgi:hypothetical protein
MKDILLQNHKSYYTDLDVDKLDDYRNHIRLGK